MTTYHVEAHVVPAIPAFEGKEVHTTKVRLPSLTGLDFGNVVLATDEVVRLVIEARVTGVAHTVNERSGDLERVQTLKALDVQVQRVSR